MTGSPLPATVTAALPSSPEGKAVLTAYFRDVVSRDHGREATRDEVASEMRKDPSDDLCPPTGLFLVARLDAGVVGCIGLLLMPGGLGEVRRVFVEPSARRRGVGAQLMRAVEDEARSSAVTRLRLDTRTGLVEARRLYARHGYREVAPFNDGRWADRWLEKSLA
jgi:GNAT superfamily N-acetyltransferase